MYVYVCVCRPMYVCNYECTCMYVCVSYVCMYVCTVYVCMYTCMHLRMYVCMCSMCVCMFKEEEAAIMLLCFLVVTSLVQGFYA